MKTKRDIQKQRNYTNKLLNEKTPFAINEAFKMLRTNLYYTTKNEACPIFGITSAYAHVGKSIIIANTAVSYAQLDRKVLLIDADMRCPVIQRIFHRENLLGLSELLASTSADRDNYKSYVVKTDIPNLDIVTSGRIPPNPSELLASDHMKVFIESAKENYDLIFIDLPPICEVSDAGVLAHLITGYLFTIRSEATDSRAVSDALEILKQMEAHVVGFVLNDVNPKQNGSYNGKYSKYGKYGKYGKYYYRRDYAAQAEENTESET